MRDFFIGVNHDGETVYITNFSWDCGWYWGGGYVQSKKDGQMVSHQHFDGLFLNGGQITGARDAYLKRSLLTDEQWYRLCDLFKRFYAYKESAMSLHRGGAHITSRDAKVYEKDEALSKAMNKHIEDVIIREIRLLLGGL